MNAIIAPIVLTILFVASLAVLAEAKHLPRDGWLRQLPAVLLWPVALLSGAALALYFANAMAQQPVTVEEEYPVLWLIVDDTAIGTIDPGTLYYDIQGNAIRVDTNELIYGCQQAVIFRDRYELKPD